MSIPALKSRVTPSSIPPLEPGDHLTRDEFERRYDATPNIKKAELIEGIVYMAPPVRWDSHGSLQLDLVAWVGVYRMGTPGVCGGDNTTVRLDLGNEPQPDALLFIDPALGGNARIEEGYLAGAPEFVAEVSSSSASFDMNTKFRVYQRNGIREYLVWRVRDREVDWFELHGAKYVRMDADAAGIIRSKVFPGLWLDAKALVASDGMRVLEVLKQGMSTPERAGFVARLASLKG
jgi:Uma2 family endonuclease